MENIVSGFGILAIVYLVFRLIKSYQRSKQGLFCKRAMFTLALLKIDALKVLQKKFSNDKVPNINYLLTHLISITDSSIYNSIKDNYYGYCKNYVDQAIEEIKILMSTDAGKNLITKEIFWYQTILEQQLKTIRLTDLKLKENRIKYFDDLNDFFQINEESTIIKLWNFLSEKYKINEDDAIKICDGLTDRESGLIFLNQEKVILKANASGGLISELDKNIFRLSNELSILNNINLNDLNNSLKL